MARRPFNILSAVFYLLALVILIQLGASIVAGLNCYNLNVATVREVGACIPITQLITQQWDKIFEAILAMLVAGGARAPPSPPAPPDT